MVQRDRYVKLFIEEVEHSFCIYEILCYCGSTTRFGLIFNKNVCEYVDYDLDHYIFLS